MTPAMPSTGALPGNLLSQVLRTSPISTFQPIATLVVTLPLSAEGQDDSSILVIQSFDPAVSPLDLVTIVIESLPGVTTPLGNISEEPPINLPASALVPLPLPINVPPTIPPITIPPVTTPTVPPVSVPPVTVPPVTVPPVTVSPIPAPPPTVTPTPTGTSTGTPQTIGLLAFPLIPGNPVGVANSVTPQPVPAIVNGPSSAAKQLTIHEDDLGFYWLPAEDQALLTPEEANELRWSDRTPPADDDSAPPPSQPAPASQTPRPPADDDLSWNGVSGAVREPAVELNEGEMRPLEIVANEGWVYGLVAAGLMGTMAPELRESLEKRTTLPRTRGASAKR
jgi:hypothetical protein